MHIFGYEADRTLRRIVGYGCLALALCALVTLLLACSVTSQLVGKTDDGGKLVGSATNFEGDPFGGTFELRTADGVHCSGIYRYTVGGKGTAPLTCTNGQVGAIDFWSDGWRGAAQGRIGERGFSLTF